MAWTRREVIGGGLAAASLCTTGLAARPGAGPPVADSRWLLWYRRPARYWVEALPVGNGRLGAMLFGGTGLERVPLNEDTLWAGGPYDPSSPRAYRALPEVRDLIAAGRYRDAQALADREMMARPVRQMPYQAPGELVITARRAPAADCDGYRRWLDLDRALAVTEWQDGEHVARRTSYASAADNVIVIEHSGSDPFDATLAFSAGGTELRDGALWLIGTNRGAHGVEGRLAYAAAVRVLGDAGTTARPDGMRVTAAAGTVTFLLAMRTSYRDWRNVDADPVAMVTEDLERAAARGTKALLERHLEAHRRYFRGFDIDLGNDPFPDVPTDDRIRFSHEHRRDDPYLAALYLQYGRYLLISASRPGSQPANLQGIWNDSNDPPWGSKYTININTEMNYWPAEPAGLGDCCEPLIRLVEDLAVSGARTASVNYGARGWVTHHNTDLWRASAPIDGAYWGLWPCGGAWLCKQLWDRWDYSRDPAVLERIYPLLKGAGLFFLDTLVEAPDGSGLVTSPSVSPENAHREGVTICAGPAMDRQILRELFDNIISASTILGVDESLRAEFARARGRLPEDRIGAAGQLQEWLEDWDMTAPEIQHRHVSHLYAVHPGHAIGPETPELFSAARRSLEIRGDDATGWGIGWRINLWARLGDGDRAYRVLRKLLGPEHSYPNLFDAHPPFQIDGNFGGAAGILEMLVRDRPQCLEFLPALPGPWPTGAVDGLRLRGGLHARIAWRDGLLGEARLQAAGPLERAVEYAGYRRTLTWQAGETHVLRGADWVKGRPRA